MKNFRYYYQISDMSEITEVALIKVHNETICIACIYNSPDKSTTTTLTTTTITTERLSSLCIKRHVLKDGINGFGQ